MPMDWRIEIKRCEFKFSILLRKIPYAKDLPKDLVKTVVWGQETWAKNQNDTSTIFLKNHELLVKGCRL